MKNLQTEYNKDIENNLPDLWDRIDKGLDEIEGPKASYEEELAKEKKVKKITKIISVSFSCTAAAAACVAICIGLSKSGFMGLSKGYPSNSSETAKMTDNKSASNSAKYDAGLQMADDVKTEDSKYMAEYAASPTPILTPTTIPDNIITLIPDAFGDVTVNDDGTYEYNGIRYLWIYRVSGPLSDISKEYADCYGECVFLTNIEDVNEVTFDRIFRYSSVADDPEELFTPDEVVIISFEAEKLQ